jgi:prevent-host-death family protein
MPRTVVHATAARARWSEILSRVLYSGERVMLVRHGRIVAAIIPADDVQLLDRLVDERDIETARRALSAGGSGATRPWDELKRSWEMEE